MPEKEKLNDLCQMLQLQCCALCCVFSCLFGSDFGFLCGRCFVNFLRSSACSVWKGNCKGFLSARYNGRCVLDAKSLGSILTAFGSSFIVHLENLVFRGGVAKNGEKACSAFS